MPKIPELNVVDLEIRKRMEEGMLAKTGRNIRGDDEEYRALLRLARMAGVDPLVHTYLEIDAAIQEMWKRWRDRAKLAEEMKRRIQWPFQS